MTIKKADATVSEIQQIINQCPEYADQAEVSEDLKKEIASNLLTF